LNIVGQEHKKFIIFSIGNGELVSLADKIVFQKTGANRKECMIGKIGQNNILNSSQNIQDVRETGQLGGRVVKVSRHRIAQEKQSEIDSKTASSVYLSMRVLADDFKTTG
ncbi:hypothetical protein GQN25_25305, partial [Escherichia coli]|uniref:hypothetical protein n=1 Tax=Escherichia coli TaxID=562 RepID=UPI0013666DDE